MADDAEIARRREIRQKKILENAEARLKKITGRKFPSQEASDLSSPELYETSEKEQVQNPKIQQSHVDLKSAAPIQTDFFTGLPLNESSNVLSNGTFHRGDVSDSYAFPKKVSDAETRSFGRTRADSRRNSSCKQLMMETLQFSSLRCNILRPWIALTIGICVKLFLILPESSFISHNLLFPYVLLELTLHIWIKLESQGDPRSNTPQSLFLGALLLCGVSPKLISALNNVMITMQYLTQDFALYLFSFVMSHFLYEKYIT